MRTFRYTFLVSFIIGFSFLSCDDQIYPELPTSDPIIAIDAWINNLSEPQVIDVVYTQGYYDNSDYAGISGAQVYVTDNEGLRFDFIETDNGKYVWTPATGETFGTIGNSYELTVETSVTTYTSSSKLSRVPTVDSVTFRHEKNDFVEGEDTYLAQFWSRDPVGPGDTYWIKTYKNEQLLNKPSEINIAYDAGFSAGGNIDGLVFITPIRENINPTDEADGDDMMFLPPYVDNDSIYVEMHSVSNEAYNFLTQVITQTDRPGGFGEFFAKPLSNISTNIFNESGAEDVVGFFCVSAVEGNGTRLDTDEVPKEE